MKFILPAVRRSLIPLIVGCLFLIVVPKCLAEDDPINSARSAAKTWLALIDAGQYDASYSSAGDGLHQVTTQAKWNLVLKSLRPVWGEVVVRNEKSHLYQPNGITGLNGECMAIAYETSFKNMPMSQELVILRLEDGKWRGVGYTAGPKPTSATNAQAVTDAPPVTETESTVHPLPGQPLKKTVPASTH